MWIQLTVMIMTVQSRLTPQVQAELWNTVSMEVLAIKLQMHLQDCRVQIIRFKLECGIMIQCVKFQVLISI